MLHKLRNCIYTERKIHYLLIHSFIRQINWEYLQTARNSTTHSTVEVSSAAANCLHITVIYESGALPVRLFRFFFLRPADGVPVTIDLVLLFNAIAF